MPAAEVDIDEPLVRALLREQAPSLADLALTPLSSGWDNVIYRLGAELTVRLPRRALAAPLVEFEQRWLPVLAPRLPLPIPAPVVAGRPGCGYPWAWNVAPWFPGDIALHVPPRDPSVLGPFLVALHQPAPADAPDNPHRGIPLRDRTPYVERAIAVLGPDVDRKAVVALWADVVSAPAWDRPPVWLHGDLHPGNVVVREGAVSAVIDFGDITAGDPATDLAIAWMMFDPAERAALRAACRCDDATWTRARGWALTLGLAYMANSADNPPFAALGRRVVETALHED